MLDFSSLPVSKVKDSKDAVKVSEDVYFTFYENKDEQLLYKELDEKLIKLENSLSIEKEELARISQSAVGFTVAVEEQMDILQRIDWLQRLYNAKEKMDSVQTKEEVDALGLSFVATQNCPMKNELLAELKSLEESLESRQLSVKDQLMNQAIEEAGENFINLGKSGREFIINEVLAIDAEKPAILQIKERTIKLEQDVERLRNTSDKTEFLNLIEKLPLISLARIPTDYSDEVINRSMKETEWDSLMTLDQKIRQIHRIIIQEEEIRREKELEIGPTTTVDARNIIE